MREREREGGMERESGSEGGDSILGTDIEYFSVLENVQWQRWRRGES